MLTKFEHGCVLQVSQLEGFIEDNLSMLCNDMEPPEVDLDRILDVPPGLLCACVRM